MGTGPKRERPKRDYLPSGGQSLSAVRSSGASPTERGPVPLTGTRGALEGCVIDQWRPSTRSAHAHDCCAPYNVLHVGVWHNAHAPERRRAP